jgi:ABC-type antimicrobial peptide transport system permease subunit
VEAGKYQQLFEEPLPAIWLPLSQQYGGTSTVVVRSTMDPSAAIAAIKTAVAEVDPNMATFDAQTLRRFLDFPMSALTFAGRSLDMMSGLAMFLSALGVYGLLAYSMVRRTREIGIRVALGASRWDVLRALTLKTAVLSTASGGIGLLLSIAVSRLLSPLLLTRPDFSSYGIAVSVVLAIAAIACIAPARRALRILPSSALRYD